MASDGEAAGMLHTFALDGRGFAFLAEFLEEHGFALLCVLHVPVLDVTVAAYGFRYRGQLDGRFVIPRIEVGDQLLDHRLELHDQTAIELAVFAVAENV